MNTRNVYDIMSKSEELTKAIDDMRRYINILESNEHMLRVNVASLFAHREAGNIDNAKLISEIAKLFEIR